MHIAAENGRVEILGKLKDNGANMDERDYVGKTPLYVAAKNGKTPVVEYLLKECQVETYPVQASFIPLDAAIEKGYRYEIYTAKIMYSI